ncbi:MAG: 2-oxoacid:acceptor oxidoreductase subunit alpha [Gammaproteobacteria bacterium]|nr:2-oxoacid:acceptor oxidoreductase subunit alpha [Gammaproteobacteria bacterium]
MAEAASISVAFLGSGGAGVLTTGSLLLEAVCAAGWDGLLTRSVGPQIRGGEACAMVRLAARVVECHVRHFDLLIAVDWLNAGRFDSEIQLSARSIVISDPQGGAPPAFVAAAMPHRLDLPLKELGKTQPQWRANMLALGAACRLLRIDAAVLQRLIVKRFGERGAALVQANLDAVRAGAEALPEVESMPQLPAPRRRSGKRWLISGNEATGLGAVRGGVRFAAAYPITPATEILEWLAPNLARVGGTLLQAEDELASINMIIGASYGGAVSLTATAGPGLALMSEGIGLAVAAEIPLVVVDVMRGGPSTGIPTKSEQADLNIAVSGLHGDAPHVVVAPQSVADCLFTAQWATYLAETLQTPALVLSDQFIGQAQTAIDRPPDAELVGRRRRAENIQGPYKRYLLGGEQVSPMSIPGTPGGQYTADGLTHDERGTPTAAAAAHLQQLDKRRAKLEQFDYGTHWATLEGEGATAVLTWGSLTGAAREAIELCRAAGRKVRLIAPRLLAPVRPAAMRAALGGVARLLVVEQTHSAQFYRYLRAHYDLPADTQVLNRPGPLPINALDIHNALQAGVAA